MLRVDGKDVRLTNLRKIFWPALGLTKGDLLQYYADVADVLLPHLRDRAMVMKRYPHGADGPFFFMKRAPSPRPAWIRICSIGHDSGNVIDFPVIDDRAALHVGDQSRLHRSESVVRAAATTWTGRTMCISISTRDPAPRSSASSRRRWSSVRRSTSLKMPSLVKTTGSKGLHVYVPIVRGPQQKQVWTFAKALAQELASRHPALMTAEYRVAKRPRGRVLVDYNQNAWGRTLASIYSVRPRPEATVSTPVTWQEVRGRRSASRTSRPATSRRA